MHLYFKLFNNTKKAFLTTRLIKLNVGASVFFIALNIKSPRATNWHKKRRGVGEILESSFVVLKLKFQTR